MQNQIEDANKPEFLVQVMQNVERQIPKAQRKRTPNIKMVQLYLLAGTHHAGRTSAFLQCQYMGINPDGYTFY